MQGPIIIYKNYYLFASATCNLFTINKAIKYMTICNYYRNTETAFALRFNLYMILSFTGHNCQKNNRKFQLIVLDLTLLCEIMGL